MTAPRTLLLATALVAVSALPLAAQGGGGGGGRGGNQEPPKNLQVLPKDMPRQQVTQIMNGFTAALGVNCQYCHTAAAGAPAAPPAGAPGAGGAPGGPPGGGRGGPPLDYSLDDKEQKKTAREMLKLVADVNAKLSAMGRTMDDRNRVTCETCHHGLSKPRTLRNAIAGALEAKGADSATALYRQLRERYYGAAAYDFSENALVNAANDANRANNRPAALALLKLNLEFYDKSAGTYQSLANIQVQAGDTAAAVDALKKGLALQPNNPQLQGMLTRLAPKPPALK